MLIDGRRGSRMSAKRRIWLDWERGLAVLFMVEVHTVDAWLSVGTPRGILHQALTMIGGFAAPSFLFMAGLSQVLADAALERRGLPRRDRQRAALRRAARLFGIAYLFRLAEYVLGGAFLVPRGWEDILRVDILNVIAVALGVSALVTLAAPRRLQPWLAGSACVVIALATPIVAGWQHAPNRVLDYVWAVFPRANFALFNWAGFLLAGSAVGSLVVERDRPFMLLGMAAALVAAGVAADALPPLYAYQDFWHTSPSWFAMRLGGVLALTALLQMVPMAADRALSWLRTMGRHSLLGYVASVELTYGLATSPLHRALSLGTVIAGIVAMIGVTWGLAVGADRFATWRAGRGGGSAPFPAP